MASTRQSVPRDSTHHTSLPNEEFHVTVVIPAKNRPNYVARAARSALNQTLRPHQVIIVDDGSDPPLKESLPSEVVREAFIEPISNGGSAAAARQAGLARVSTLWVAFLDSDDWWQPEHLAKAVKYIARNNAGGGLGGYIATFGENQYISYVSSTDPTDYSDFAIYLFVRGGLCRTSTFVCRTAFAKEIGFDETIRHDDWDFGLRFHDQARWVYYSYLTTYVDHRSADRFSFRRDPEASLTFLGKHRDRLSRLQRNNFRLRVARSSAVRFDRHATQRLLRDAEPPLSLHQITHACTSRLLTINKTLTAGLATLFIRLRAMRSTFRPRSTNRYG